MAILYTKIVSGELIGVTSATQLPDIACTRVTLKAEAANPTFVYLGGAGVTKKDGSTDATGSMLASLCTEQQRLRIRCGRRSGRPTASPGRLAEQIQHVGLHSVQRYRGWNRATG